MGKAFEKQTETSEDKKHQINAIKEHGKQRIESEVGKNDFNIDRSGVSHAKQKEIFNKLVEYYYLF